MRSIHFSLRRSLRRVLTPVAPAVLAMGTLVACVSPQQRVADHEDRLAAAGFIVKPANTPERQQMLQKLPPHKFVQRPSGDGVDYVYADPLVCDCLYVGTQRAYDTYKRDQLQQHLIDEQQMTAQMYTDSSWNWGAWGPWGPGFSFGYGRGW